MGAGASVVMALAFYLARPIVDTAHGTLWSDLFYWAVVGLISGAVLAVVSARILKAGSSSTERQNSR
jgi:hypothetical protein